MKNKEACIPNFTKWLKENPREESQSIEDRAMAVYREGGIEEYDRLEALERETRAEQARVAQAARYYAYLHLPTRVEHKVLLTDLEAFSEQTHIPLDVLIALGEGWSEPILPDTEDSQLVSSPLPSGLGESTASWWSCQARLREYTQCA